MPAVRLMRGPVRFLAGDVSWVFEKRVLRAIRRAIRPDPAGGVTSATGRTTAATVVFVTAVLIRYKRQTLPPYRQRSTEFAEAVEILAAGRHNRYKPQGLTVRA